MTEAIFIKPNNGIYMGLSQEIFGIFFLPWEWVCPRVGGVRFNPETEKARIP
jgi:hypothetical protein